MTKRRITSVETPPAPARFKGPQVRVWQFGYEAGVLALPPTNPYDGLRSHGGSSRIAWDAGYLAAAGHGRPVTTSAICCRCERNLPLVEYQKDAASRLGRHSYCRDCAHADYLARREKVLEGTRRNKRGPTYKAARSRDYYKSDPKEIARRALREAVVAGKIPKPSNCGNCGATGKIEGHHADYSQPFEVEWLCTACHALLHRKQAVLVAALIGPDGRKP